MSAEQTWIQFQAAGRANQPIQAEEPRLLRCPTCQSRFSSEGRFCPFDATPLEVCDDDPHADPLIGSVVDGRYEVTDVLGEGGMGIVYSVRHTRLGRRLALKALKRDLANDRALSARFIQEARAAAAVTHPNVVQITDFGGLPSGQVYFVMEYLDGRSLSWLIRRGGPIPAARAVGIARQVAQALAAAHEAHVVHRDLKPENIHLSDALGEPETVKVLDFGLARLAGQTRLTKDGVVFGTPHYMSPEQAMGEEVDHRADIYALGVVMYEMFTGRVPFEADSYMGVLTKHMYQAPIPPSQLLGPTAELGALEDMTLRCLEKKPDRRYASMNQFLRELNHVTRFTEDGGVRVRGSSRRGPAPTGLADQLELPTAPELRLYLGRGFTRSQRLVLWFTAGFALAGGLLLLRNALLAEPDRPANVAASPVSKSSTASPVVAASPPTQSVPSVVVSPDWLKPVAPPSAKPGEPEVEIVPAAPSAIAAPTPAPDPRPVRRQLLERREPHPSDHPPDQAHAPARRQPPSGSEIIDPWGP